MGQGEGTSGMRGGGAPPWASKAVHMSTPVQVSGNHPDPVVYYPRTGD